MRVLTAILWMVAVLTTPVAAETPDPRDLRQELAAAYRSQDWDRAVGLGLALEKAQPGRWQNRYDLACLYALSGDQEAAISWLHQAAESGLRRVRLIDNDADLDSIRDAPGFTEVRSLVARNWEAYAAFVRARFAAQPPLVVEPDGVEPEDPVTLLIALHGHGDHPEGWPRYWSVVTRSRNILLVAPASPHGFGEGFTWAGVDEAELVVDEVVRWAREHYTLNDRALLSGFSQGGWIAFALGQRRPDLFSGVIPMACGFAPRVDTPDEAPANAPRFYFAVGSGDDAQDTTRAAAKAFENAGYESRFRVYRSAGHTFPMALDRELTRALRFVMATGD
jgi:predicted esterase